MYRVLIEDQGAPGVMKVVEYPDPDPGAGEVLVRVAAAGVNVVDLFQRSGAYAVTLPFTPGFEGSGTVLRAGPGVTGVAEGDRVGWAGAPGSYATHCVVAADRLVPLPRGMSMDEAAAALVQGMTAHFLATDVVLPEPGGTCLVHAAAGGVGGLLCQFAAARGLTVIGTVSHPGKEQAAREAGARDVICYEDGRFAGQVRELTGGRGVDVVYDGVGRTTFAESLRCLRPRGSMVSYGQTSGPVESFDPQLLLDLGSLFLTKVSLRHYDPTQDAMRRRAATVLADVLTGRLRLRVHGAYSLEDAAAAHEDLESRVNLGKVLLHP